jgi:hypothetical protein
MIDTESTEEEEIKDYTIRLAKEMGKSYKEFIDWTQSFKPDFISYTNHEDTPCCCYTDGDTGVMVFEAFSEVFMEKGCQIKLIACAYCDIDYDTLLSIALDLEDRGSEHYEKLLTEEEEGLQIWNDKELEEAISPSCNISEVETK